MRKRHSIGLALAGGGPFGAVYEIGALIALEEALEGLDLNRLDCYVGVSAGSIAAAATFVETYNEPPRGIEAWA